MEPGWLEEINKKLVEAPADVVLWGYNIVYQDRIERHFFDTTITLQQAKAKFLIDEWKGFVWNRCWKRELFADVRFPTEFIIVEDLWVTGSLMVKAKSLSFIDKCLYNYWMLNTGSITANINSIKLYWFAITRFHLGQLLKQEGLPYLDICNIRILDAVTKALLVGGEDKLLTSEQTNQLNTILSDYEHTVEQVASSLCRYKVYEILARFAWVQRRHQQAMAYYYKYVVTKAKHCLHR